MNSPQISTAFLALFLLLLIQTQTSLSYQYKVGDLDSWGVPPPSNKHVYSYWSQRHHFQIGDSLLFLYPPSQDSVIQVTMQAFNSCSISDPILKMSDGNSIFNITKPGTYYFTSGVPAHCQKNQKLEVAVPMANGIFLPPAGDGAAAGPGSAMSPSSSAFPIIFGPSAAAAERSAAAEVRMAVAAMWAVVIVGVFLVNLV
ncbi:putative Phytocyanin domain, cupredoxin [Dioscorea sansibarensis]